MDRGDSMLDMQDSNSAMSDLSTADIASRPGASTCPLTIVQAATMIHHLKQMVKEMGEIKTNQNLMRVDIAELKLDKAKNDGFKSGAGFWFKAGVVTTALAVWVAIIAIIAIVTGRLDLTTLFKLL